MKRIDVDREYFLDEVRDGFFVPGIMKKAWAVSILAYKELESFCDELGVGVFFIFGNLIGAVRHGGSIPWDDDIDVSMLSPDFQKLKAYVGEHGAPGDFRLRDFTEMKNGNFFRKWYDDINPVKNIDKWKDYYGFPYVGVTDIMPMDYVPDSEEELERYRAVSTLLQELKDYADLMEAGEQVDKQDYWECQRKVEQTVGEKYDHKRDGSLSVWAWKMMEKFCCSYGPDQCDDVILMSYYIRRGDGRYPASYMKDCIDIPFEFTTVRAPVGYERHLRDFYTNYMVPKLDGSPHAYPYYRILEEALKEKYDLELWTYRYESDTVREVMADRGRAVTVAEDIAERLEVMREAHAYILAQLKAGSLTDELTDVLGSCQELAVLVGERAEKRLKKPEELVGALENYCEVMYGVYQSVMTVGGVETDGQPGAVSDGDGATVDASKLEEFLSGFEDMLERLASGLGKDDEKKQVLFLVRTPEDWRSLHSIYIAACSTEGYEVTAIVTPYFYKTDDGDIDTEHPVMRGDGYPEEVIFTDFTTYDIEREHPDIVFFQCPYDGCHESMLIHPVFYAENIVKHTDKLVLVPPFKVMEVGANDGRSRYTLGRFVRTPGYVYADAIVAQSEGMRDVYVELLSAMTEEIDWASKILPLGTAVDDAVFLEEKAKEGNQKTVVSFLSPSIVFEFGEKALDRTEELLTYVKEHPMADVRLVCFTDPATEEIVEKYHPDQKDRFRQIMTEGNFSVLQIGCLELSSDGVANSADDVDSKTISVIRSADGYIGDPHCVYTRCAGAEKPAMVLAPDALKESYGERTIEAFFREVRDWRVEMTGRDGLVGNGIWEKLSV